MEISLDDAQKSLQVFRSEGNKYMSNPINVGPTFLSLLLLQTRAEPRWTAIAQISLFHREELCQACKGEAGEERQRST